MQKVTTPPSDHTDMLHSAPRTYKAMCETHARAPITDVCRNRQVQNVLGCAGPSVLGQGMLAVPGRRRCLFSQVEFFHSIDHGPPADIEISGCLRLIPVELL